MPVYLADPNIWKAIWPVFAFAMLISIFMTLVLTRNRRIFLVVLLSMLSMALLGLTAGKLTGFSRVPAVHAVMPAVLTLIGGLLVYVVSSSDQNSKAIASSAIICLSTGLLFGTMWGSRLRQDFDDYQRSPAYLIEVARDEAAVRLVREAIEEGVRRMRVERNLPQPRETPESEAELDGEPALTVVPVP
jgi:hypothetical protein